MSSTHRHLLLDFFWQVISGPPCICYSELRYGFVVYIENMYNVETCRNELTVSKTFIKLKIKFYGPHNVVRFVLLDLHIVRV
jgi:hypothetical protein